MMSSRRRTRSSRDGTEADNSGGGADFSTDCGGESLVGSSMSGAGAIGFSASSCVLSVRVSATSMTTGPPWIPSATFSPSGYISHAHDTRRIERVARNDKRLVVSRFWEIHFSDRELVLSALGKSAGI